MKITLKKIYFTLIFFAILPTDSFSATAVGTASARVVVPIAVTAGSSLQFGSFAASSTAGTINQAGVTTGGVLAIAGGSARSAGTFTVTGENSTNTAYTFSMPATVTLSSGSNSMTATLSYGSGNGARTLISGTDTVTVNGVLAVGANQVAGAYTGTYTVTAVY